MQKVTSFYTIAHGLDHVQYFPGYPTIHMSKDHVVIGVGDSLRNAANDAIEQIAQEYDTEVIPDAKELVPHDQTNLAKFGETEQNEDLQYYFVIYYNVH